MVEEGGAFEPQSSHRLSTWVMPSSLRCGVLYAAPMEPRKRRQFVCEITEQMPSVFIIFMDSSKRIKFTFCSSVELSTLASDRLRPLAEGVVVEVLELF